jgi:hypothetical protein
VPSDNSAAGGGYRQPAARERGFDSRVECVGAADLADRLERRSHVRPVVTQHRHAPADLACPGGRAGVGAEMVVEPPGPDPVAQAQQLGRALRVGELAEHAGVVPDRERSRPRSVVIPYPHEAAEPVAEYRGRAEHRPVPYRFALDHRVPRERRLGFLRQTEVDGVAEGVLAEAELQRDGLAPARRALHRITALPDRAPDLLWASTEGGLQSAFAGQCGDHPVPGAVREQP